MKPPILTLPRRLSRLHALSTARTIISSDVEQGNSRSKVKEAIQAIKNNSILVFGSNTDVGKTLISTGMVKHATNFESILYVKPVQTGSEKDGSFVPRYAGSNRVNCRTLFEWKSPVSPHLAAMEENCIVPDDIIQKTLLEAIVSHISEAEATQSSSLILVETAGGALSPAPSSSLQVPPRLIILYSISLMLEYLHL